MKFKRNMRLNCSKALVAVFAVFVATMTGCTKRSSCEWVEGAYYSGTFNFLETTYMINGHEIKAELEVSINGTNGTIRFTGNIPKAFHNKSGIRTAVVCEPVIEDLTGIPCCYRIKCIEKIN